MHQVTPNDQATTNDQGTGQVTTETLAPDLL